MVPVIWSISGLDTSGGAGLAVDIKTCAVFGVHCCPLLTSVAIQDHDQVFSIKSVDTESLKEQINILKKQMLPQVIKIGLIKSKELMQLLCHELKQFTATIILDPILQTSSGFWVHDPGEFQFYQNNFLQLATIITPNLPEAEKLLGMKLNTLDDIELAAEKLLALGVEQVIIKGGHAKANQVYDYWTSGKVAHWFVTNRIVDKSVRGTGCAFASSLAANLARGELLLTALQNTKRFLTQSIKNSVAVCHNKQILNYCQIPFPRVDQIGFYPIVSDLTSLTEIIAQGVTTVQFRIKTDSNLEATIKQACEIARKVKLQLFINDHWELAIKFGAFGVHLGQEDLMIADLECIKKCGLRMGISVHNMRELQQAQSLQPSYIAIGPVFPSRTKNKLQPLTMHQIKILLQKATCPVVAIGGITLLNVNRLAELPFAGFALISALQTKPLGVEVKKWLAIFQKLKLC